VERLFGGYGKTRIRHYLGNYFAKLSPYEVRHSQHVSSQNTLIGKKKNILHRVRFTDNF